MKKVLLIMVALVLFGCTQKTVTHTCSYCGAEITSSLIEKTLISEKYLYQDITIGTNHYHVWCAIIMQKLK